ncbi:putative acetyltransferase [Minicystis rosea]|nr:putative acetyltransferase [Minicystis rosea]
MLGMPEPLPTITLSGAHVRLEPLSLGHVDALAAAAGGARETYALTFVPDGAAAMRGYVEEALAAHAAGSALPFATVDVTTGRVVGSTRFGWMEHWPWPRAKPDDAPVGAPDAAEIGWTWLAPDVQRTSINTEQKLLMLTHAFEAWRVRRISFITDARNARSRAALERIGARFEGLRRAHFPAPDGTIRDSATFSILLAEWPDTKARLERLSQRRASVAPALP